MAYSEKEYKKNVKDFARVLYAYLKEHCIGREISTMELVYEAVEPVPSYNSEGEPINPDSPFFPFTEHQIWDVHNALLVIVAQGHKYDMDFDNYANQCVGLPYNIPFIFRLKKDKNKCWEELVPFFKSGRSYLKWLREGYHNEDCEGAYFDYFRELRQAVDPLGYEQAVPEKEMRKALMRSQVTGEMIDVVPDTEFQPGGEREGQLDGWTYHLEFVSHEEYFKRHPMEMNDEQEH